MESSFQRHLGTNYVPSINEERQIQDFLELSSKEILDIDIEIDQLHRQLELLQAKRLKIFDLAEQHRALLSPARRLSRDILEAIFLACLPTDRNPCMSATEAPMLLTRISSSWRNIAHTTPKLWAAIHIVLPSVDTNIRAPPHATSYIAEREALVHLKLDQREAGAKEWLKRSGVCPLSISIYRSLYLDTHGQLDEPHPDIVQKFLELYLSFINNILVPYQKRWHDIDMCVTAETLNGLLRRSGPDGLTPGCMTMLKNVHIHVMQWISRSWNLIPLEQWRISQLVQLRDIVGLFSSQINTVAISGIGVSPRDLSSTLKHVWGKLTELNLELDLQCFPEVNLCSISSGVIHHCLALKILKLNLKPSHFKTRNNTDTQLQAMVDIPLHHLTTLSLSLFPTTDTMDFVKHLYLPSIQRLDCEFSRSKDVFTLALDILKMVLRASGDGVSLRLYIPAWVESSTQMLQVLQNIPHLTSLMIASTGIQHDKWSKLSIQHFQFQGILNDDLLSALSPAGKKYSEIICPKLEVLEFDSKLVSGITEQGLRDCVKARRDAHLRDLRIAPLRKLCMPINDYKQDVPVDEVSLGKDSAIYFRMRENDVSLSPSEGLEVGTYEWFKPLKQVIYTKI